jgi:hypothetical protein
MKKRERSLCSIKTRHLAVPEVRVFYWVGLVPIILRGAPRPSFTENLRRQHHFPLASSR